jgi:hypothetical protein
VFGQITPVGVEAVAALEALDAATSSVGIDRVGLRLGRLRGAQVAERDQAAPQLRRILERAHRA